MKIFIIIIIGFIFQILLLAMAGILKNLPEQLCKDPKYNGKNMTNRVLVSETVVNSKLKNNNPLFMQSHKKKVTYYCPAYMRIKIKNFSELSHEDLQAAVNMNIVLTINFRGISPLIQNKIISLLRLSFNRDASLIVQQDASTTKPEKNGMYTFIIPKCLHVAIKPDIFCSPFEKLFLIMSIEIQDIQISQDLVQQVIEQANLMLKKLENESKQQTDQIEKIKNKQLINQIHKQIDELDNIQAFYVRFNMMDCLNQQMKINFTAEGTFGNYDLAQALLSVQYTNHSICNRVREKFKQKQKQQEQNQIDYSLIKPYKYAHFQIPLYKFPMVTLSTIFIPLWLLSIITIGIYFQEAILIDRVQSVSTLLIAFVQLISVIRQQIPLSPKISLLQYLVYIQLVCTCILLLIHSISIKINEQPYSSQLWRNGFFYVSSIVTGVQFIIIVLLVVFHKICWQPSYNREPNENELPFKYEKWEKNDCDQHYRRKIDKGLIKVAIISQQVQEMKNYLPTLTKEQKQSLSEVEEANQEMKTTFLKEISPTKKK